MQKSLRILSSAKLDAQRVHLVFHLQTSDGQRFEEIQAWIEESESLQPPSSPFSTKEYRIRRRRTLPYSQEKTELELITNDLYTAYSAEDAQQHLQEFTYLWIGGREGIQTLVPNQELQARLQIWLQSYEHTQRRSNPFVTAVVCMQDVASRKQEGIQQYGQIIRSVGYAGTLEELRHLILLLPVDCSAFEIVMRLTNGQHIGNASYHVENEVDPATGKRTGLFWHEEFGACVNVHQAFVDLYNSSAEFDQWVERSAEFEIAKDS